MKMAIVCGVLLFFPLFSFAQPTPEDSKWLSNFNFAKRGEVYAITKIDSEVYVVGNFLFADRERVNRVAMWDGHKWHALRTSSGNGIPGGLPRAVVAKGDDVYVGGEFTFVGGIRSPGVARWSRSKKEWSSLKEGININDGVWPHHTVNALAFYDTLLAVGGVFTKAGQKVSNSIAFWDGSDWIAAASRGVEPNVGGYPSPDAVHALYSHKKTLYVGGAFSKIGGVSCGKIAAWNGKAFSAPFGIDNVVYQITGSFSKLYFAETKPSRYAAITEYDLPVASHRKILTTNGDIHSLAYVNDTLYFGGDFTVIDSSSNARFIGAWKDSLIRANDADGRVRALFASDSFLYAGGTFTAIDNKYLNGMSLYKEGDWHSLSAGVTIHGTVCSIVKDNEGNIFAAGDFVRVDTSVIHYVAQQDKITGSWLPLGKGTNGVVRNLSHYNGKIYAVGGFTSAGDKRVGNIAFWDGKEWQPLGDSVQNGTNGYVSCIAIDKNGDVYIGGQFSSVGGKEISKIAKFSNGQWAQVGNAILDSTAYPNTIAFLDDVLYLGGNFKVISGDTVNGIAKWDGNNWLSLDNGVNGSIENLAYYDGSVIAGGSFKLFKDSAVRNLALFDGSEWERICENPNRTVMSLLVRDSLLYFGGPIDSIEGRPFYQIGICNLTTGAIRNLGSGTTTFGFANYGGTFSLMLDGNQLYVGGYFDTAGRKASCGMAIWNAASDRVGSIHNKKKFTVSVFPQPSEKTISIQFGVHIPDDINLAIVDQLGREFNIEYYQSYSERVISFARPSLPPGFYLLKITSDYYEDSIPIIFN